jgi:hypothetical protein
MDKQEPSGRQKDTVRVQATRSFDNSQNEIQQNVKKV